MIILRRLSCSAGLTVLSLVACGGRTDVGDLLPEPNGGGASGGQTGNGGLPFFTGGAWGIGGAAPTGGVPIGAGGLWSGGALATGGAFVTGGAFWAGGSGPGGSGGSGEPTCPPEYFDPPGDPLGDCKPVSHCDPGWYVYWEPTPWGDRVCAPCPSGYTTKSDSPFCTGWTECAFDQIEIVAGTPTSDSACGPNDQISAVPISGDRAELAAPPGELLLLTGESASPRFRRFGSPGFAPLEDAQWAQHYPNQDSGRLIRGTGSKVFYVSTGSAYTNYGYGASPFAALVDGSAASPVWRSATSWYGYQTGAAVLPDGTLVTLASIYQGYGWEQSLISWSGDGTPSQQALTVLDPYDSAWLAGSDGAGSLHVLRAEPPAVFRLDSFGNELSRISLESAFSYLYLGTVTAGGATYVAGWNDSGFASVARLAPDGSLGIPFRWPNASAPAMLRALGENLIAGGCTQEAWPRPVRGYGDALVVEIAAGGGEVRSWQFGGGGSDCVVSGDVADDGRITVAAYGDYSHRLVELLQ
jgi:hypothetical protein